MNQANSERKFIQAIIIFFGATLVVCAALVRMPFNIIDAVVGTLALLFAFIRLRVRKRPRVPFFLD